MQETAPFVSGLVRRRPRLSSSAPPNKSFICILKLIHNLKQKERHFKTEQQSTYSCLCLLELFVMSASILFIFLRKFSIIRDVLRKGRLGCNTEGSLGFLLFSSSSKQRALCWHSSGAGAQAIARRGERHFQVLLHIHDIFNTWQDIYISVCLCFGVFTTPVRNDQSHVIIQAVQMFCSQPKVICGGPDSPPSLFGCFSFCLPLLFSLVSSYPHCGDLSALTCKGRLPHGQGQRLIKLVPIVSILQISLSQQV